MEVRKWLFLTLGMTLLTGALAWRFIDSAINMRAMRRRYREIMERREKDDDDPPFD